MRVINADAVSALRTLDSESVHCCVTSPPYWKQRDYGVSGQIGQEANPLEYAEALVAVFREVRRVLRSDGTLWLNLGDTFARKSPALVPQIVAMSLANDGWVFRQDIIWRKPAPMPESVRNRCARAHEHVLLFAKSADYYFDALAAPEFRHDVWTIPSKGYTGAHFAVMPERLAEVCILLGTSESGCCDNCGSPHRRVVERTRVPTRPGIRTKAVHRPAIQGNRDPLRHVTMTRTLGWEPSCDCDRGRAACVVLDPFAGSGTTLAVSQKLGRDAVGIELNPDYVGLMEERIS